MGGCLKTNLLQWIASSSKTIVPLIWLCELPVSYESIAPFLDLTSFNSKIDNKYDYKHNYFPDLR